MKENKNIERLFQEKFKDFEALPPLESWDAIEARLNQKKKKRRIIPFWFKPVGIAASLILGFFLFMNRGNDSAIEKNNPINSDINSISNVGNEFEQKKSTTNKTQDQELLLDNKNTFTKEQLTENNTNKIIENENSTINENFIQNKNQNKGVVLNEKSKTINKSLVNKKENKILKYNNTIVNGGLKNKGQNNLNKEKVSNSQLQFNQNNEIQNEDQSFVVNKTKQNSVEQKSKEYLINKSNNLSNENKIVLNDSEENSNTLIDQSKIELLNSDNSIIVSENNINKTDTLQEHNKKIIANENAIQDSILLASNLIEENPLEKLLKEKLEGKNADEKEEEKRNKWAISTVASPVYFNSTTDGSPIDEQFKNNQKSFDNSLSYGLGVEYGISKKLSIKTGVNTLDFNYSTSDVFYTTTLRSVDYNVKTIARNSNGENIILANRNTMITNDDVENYVQNNIGALNQNISYFEVPLELSYKILDKRFSVDIVGGMSTLFLNENSVSLNSSGFEMEIGKANNLNNIHFSSNVGLGFKYTFWKSFQANFQPMFKYQINTFSNDAGNFRPYFIGLYSGLSFSF